MDFSTTFRSDYVPHPVVRRLRLKTLHGYVTPPETMMMITTYMRDFKAFSANKYIVGNRNTKYEAPTAKMDTQSLYTEDYQCWNAVRPEAIRTSDNLKVSNDLQYTTGTSTFQDHYCPKPTAEVGVSFKPTAVIQESKQFQGISNYKLMYVPHEIHRRPPKDKVPYKPNHVPFCGVTIYRQDFKGLRGEVAQSFKTIATYKANTVLFKGSSETKDKYKAWPGLKYFQRKTSMHCPPEGDIGLISTAPEDLEGQTGQQVLALQPIIGQQVLALPPIIGQQVLALPPIKAWCQRKPFEACSTMKADYRAWEAKKRSQVAHREKIIPPAEALQTTTSNWSEHIK